MILIIISTLIYSQLSVNTLTSKYWVIEHIASFDTGFEVVIDGNYFKPEVAFKELTFIDGTPFGIKDE